MKKNYKDHNSALVLSGGGARAAYQVGVLKGITKMVPRNHGSPFPIICGTSAGAINGTALACYASCFHLGVKKLEWVWKNFHTSMVYRSSMSDVGGHLLHNAMNLFRAQYAEDKPVSLFDNSPLRNLLSELMDFKRIDMNLVKGYLSAVSVTASCYSSGDSICFFQADEQKQNWRRAKRRSEHGSLNLDHLLASAAIPLIFPSVKIGQSYFGDGSVHQLSPLSPAIHLGAERIMVIGVAATGTGGRHQAPHHPDSATIAGHLLDSIFADTLTSDLERTERINQTVALIPEEKRKEANLRTIDTLMIAPKHNFDAIAAEHYEELPFAVKQLLKMIGVTKDSESSLVSYLLFESGYCRHLMELGFNDAMARKDEIEAFLFGS